MSRKDQELNDQTKANSLRVPPGESTEYRTKTGSALENLPQWGMWLPRQASFSCQFSPTPSHRP
jgi:hypothetical protein